MWLFAWDRGPHGLPDPGLENWLIENLCKCFVVCCSATNYRGIWQPFTRDEVCAIKDQVPVSRNHTLRQQSSVTTSH